MVKNRAKQMTFSRIHEFCYDNVFSLYRNAFQTDFKGRKEWMISR